MKNFTKVLILALMITMTLNISASANGELPYTNTLKQGIYSETGPGAIKPGKVKFQLVSLDSPVYVYIIDKNTIERFSKKFSATSPSSQVNLLEGDFVIIFGKGEIHISNAPM
ncbi:hypothetical protein [Clostridium sp.]|uniref:hypothetical protein n=1 Tax=Clostridium sp. TaxID=1506 RepID=UPI003217C32B